MTEGVVHPAKRSRRRVQAMRGVIFIAYSFAVRQVKLFYVPEGTFNRQTAPMNARW
jgi:hypothetical protein